MIKFLNHYLCIFDAVIASGILILFNFLSAIRSYHMLLEILNLSLFESLVIFDYNMDKWIMYIVQFIFDDNTEFDVVAVGYYMHVIFLMHMRMRIHMIMIQK